MMGFIEAFAQIQVDLPASPGRVPLNFLGHPAVRPGSPDYLAVSPEEAIIAFDRATFNRRSAGDFTIPQGGSI